MQAIVTSFVFMCNGRVSSIAASMSFIGESSDLPVIQIWRPTPLNSSVYHNIGQVQVTNTTSVTRNHHCIISLSNNTKLEFQPGDVIGYYQSFYSSHLIWNILEMGYTSYGFNTSNASTASVNVTELTRDNQRRPLIKITFGMDYKCDKCIEWEG